MRATPGDSTSDISTLVHALPCVFLGRPHDYSDYSSTSSGSSTSSSFSSSSSSSFDDHRRRHGSMRWGFSPGMPGQGQAAVPAQVTTPDPNAETLVKTLYNNLMKYNAVSDVSVFKKLLNERKAVVNLLHERDLAQAIMSGNMEQLYSLLLTKLSSTGNSDQTSNSLLLYLAASLAPRIGTHGAPNAFVAPQNVQFMAPQYAPGQRMGAPAVTLLQMVPPGQPTGNIQPVPSGQAVGNIQPVASGPAMVAGQTIVTGQPVASGLPMGFSQMGLLGVVAQQSAEQRYLEEGRQNVVKAQARVHVLEGNKSIGI
eukprot:Protomagalhaensia_sp_Gyna_25__2920@NODE_270_length_4101_cov_127_083210_g209_i0_p2_GENE_NODE_270_length_4101_cov_127_083210_g209_i0NODE_270_length_4101_cov_127_083210_g209_i0_p2_ORF_typecomplete_len327_score33_27_NODE_270_length_4101_cov_127_083210_g209_i047982